MKLHVVVVLVQNLARLIAENVVIFNARPGPLPTSFAVKLDAARNVFYNLSPDVVKCSLPKDLTARLAGLTPSYFDAEGLPTYSLQLVMAYLFIQIVHVSHGVCTISRNGEGTSHCTLPFRCILVSHLLEKSALRFMGVLGLTWLA
jgi:hypothetical protein